MQIIQYIKVRDFCDFHQTRYVTIQEFSDSGLIELSEQENEPCIHCNDIERLETMLRLHDDLGINTAGIETILQMRERMQEMQQRLREMELRIRRLQG